MSAPLADDEIRLPSPTAILGYGFPESSFTASVRWGSNRSSGRGT
jgi:hypothetical protein